MAPDDCKVQVEKVNAGKGRRFYDFIKLPTTVFGGYV